MKQSEMLILAKEARKTNEEHIKNQKWSQVNNAGVAWGGSKADGKLYHAYCEFQYREGFKHPLKKDGFFEDCIQTSKEDNANEARKKGWVIGRGKLSDFAICPLCVEILNQRD